MGIMGFPFPHVSHGMQQCAASETPRKILDVCQWDLHSHWAPSSLGGLQDKGLNIHKSHFTRVLKMCKPQTK